MGLCQDMAAKYFPASAQDTAQAVCECESGGNAGAVGDNGTSFGLWQIHTPAHPQYDASSLLDPDYNAQAAVAVSNGGTNWNPWSTYTNGCYLSKLTGSPLTPSGGSSSPVYSTAAVMMSTPSAPAISGTEKGVLTLTAILLLLDLVAD